MKLIEWMEKERRNQAWLSEQLGVSESRLSYVFKAYRNGDEIPRGWAPDIIRITSGEVGIDDEWPDPKPKRVKSNA